MFSNHQIICECFWYNRWDQTSERIFPPITQDTSFPSDVSVYPELVLIDWIICHQPPSFPIWETSKQNISGMCKYSIFQYLFSIFQFFSILQCFPVIFSFFFSLLPGTFLTDWIIYLSFPIRGPPPQQKRKEYFTNVYDVYAGQTRPREIIFNMCVSPIPPSSANNQQ